MTAPTSSDPLITTSEAARRLGVKPATLYAYVSRGILISRRQPGQRESLFSRADIEALATGHRAHPGSAQVRFRRVTTAVSSFVDGELFLRELSIADIFARDDIVWSWAYAIGLVDAAAPVPPEPAAPPIAGLVEASAKARPIARGAPLNRRIPLWVSMITAHLPPDAASSPDLAFWVTCQLPSLVDDVVDLGDPLLRAQAILLIDNGLTISTTCARVAASSRAGLTAALTAGYAGMSGPLHGAAPIAAAHLIGELATGDRELDQLVEDYEHRVPGFGHVIYKVADPRFELAWGRFADLEPTAPALAVVDQLRAHVRAPANVDLATAAILHQRGLPPEVGEVLFQLGRTAGMCGHILEEYAEAPLRWRGTAEPER